MGFSGILNYYYQNGPTEYYIHIVFVNSLTVNDIYVMIMY